MRGHRSDPALPCAIPKEGVEAAATHSHCANHFLSKLECSNRDSTTTLDTDMQISAFTKLKLTKCARPGNRAGSFHSWTRWMAFR